MDETSQLVALHSTVVDTASAAESRRQNISVVSASLISGGLAFLGFDSPLGLEHLVVPLLIISSIWFVSVRFYSKLAKAKWEVIHEIENSLAYRPFTREWELFDQQNPSFKIGPSDLEQIIPALIFLVSAGYGMSSLYHHWASVC